MHDLRTEDLLLLLDVLDGGELSAEIGQDRVALLRRTKPEDGQRLDHWQQFVDLQLQVAGQHRQILATATFVEVRDQTNDVVDARVRQHLIRPFDNGHLDRPRQRQDVLDARLRTGHQPIDRVDQRAVLRCLLPPLLQRQARNVRADATWISCQDDQPISQANRFVDVVRNHQDRLGGHLAVRPQVEQLVAQVLGG